MIRETVLCTTVSDMLSKTSVFVMTMATPRKGLPEAVLREEMKGSEAGTWCMLRSRYCS